MKNNPEQGQKEEAHSIAATFAILETTSSSPTDLPRPTIPSINPAPSPLATQKPTSSIINTTQVQTQSIFQELIYVITLVVSAAIIAVVFVLYNRARAKSQLKNS